MGCSRGIAGRGSGARLHTEALAGAVNRFCDVSVQWRRQGGPVNSLLADWKEDLVKICESENTLGQSRPKNGSQLRGESAIGE